MVGPTRRSSSRSTFWTATPRLASRARCVAGAPKAKSCAVRSRARSVTWRSVARSSWPASGQTSPSISTEPNHGRQQVVEVVSQSASKRPKLSKRLACKSSSCIWRRSVHIHGGAEHADPSALPFDAATDPRPARDAVVADQTMFVLERIAVVQAQHLLHHPTRVVTIFGVDALEIAWKPVPSPLNAKLRSSALDQSPTSRTDRTARYPCGRRRAPSAIATRPRSRPGAPHALGFVGEERHRAAEPAVTLAHGLGGNAQPTRAAVWRNETVQLASHHVRQSEPSGCSRLRRQTTASPLLPSTR